MNKPHVKQLLTQLTTLLLKENVPPQKSLRMNHFCESKLTLQYCDTDTLSPGRDQRTPYYEIKGHPGSQRSS